MIEKVDQELRDWVKGVLGEVGISFDAPCESQSGAGVSLYLFELANAPPMRTTKRPPLQFSLRYLVTSWAEEAEEAHRLQGQLVLAAMENARFEVEFEPLPIAAWVAFGVVPRPAFGLRVLARQEKEEATAVKPKRHILKLDPI